MKSIPINQLMMFSVEAIIIALLVLFLFRTRSRFGLAPLFVTLGVFQPIQVLLAASIYAEILPGVIVSPGSVILFTASLFAILLVYIREDAIEARKVIYGIMLANMTMTLLLFIFGLQLTLPDTLNFLNLSRDIFNQNARVMFTGTIVLFGDAILIIFVYEAVWRLITRNLFLRIYLTMALILTFDSLAFVTGAFYGQSNYVTILTSGIIGKLVMATFYALALTIYLRYADLIDREAQPFEDIFYALSYRQKFEIEHARGQQTESLLRESEGKYQTLARVSPVGIFRTDPNGFTNYVNPKWCDISGLSFDNALGDGWLNAVHPDDKEKINRGWQESTQLHKASYSEYRFVRPDGTSAWVIGQAVPEMDSENQIVGYVGTITDISERKQTEETLRASEERYRLITQNAEDIIWTANMELRVTYASPSLERALGYTTRELMALPPEQLLMAESFANGLKVFSEEVTAVQPQPDPGYARVLEMEYRRKDGSTFWAEMKFSFFRDPSGRPTGVLGVGRDITLRKQADEKLRESEERFRIMADSAPVLVWMSGVDKQCTYFNKGWLDFTGRTMEQDLGNGWTEDVYANDLERCMQNYVTAFDARESFEMEYRLRRYDGKYRWIVDIGVPRYLPSGEFTGYIGSCIDITERKQTEAALRRSQEEYKILLNTIDGVVWEADAKTFVFSYVSQQAERLLGYPIERWTSEPTFWKDHIHVDDQNWAVNYCIACTQAKISHEFEYRMIASNGHIVWLRDIVTVIVENDLPVKLRGIMVDITERKQAEEALRESQQRLSLFFSQSLDGFFFSMLDEPIEWNDASDKEKLLDYVITHQGITEANDAMIEQYGATRESFIGRTGGDFFAHDLDQVRSFRRKLFDAGHLHLETEERKDDGTPIWVEGDYVCMYDLQKRITGMFGIQRDVTLRKHADDTLRTSEDRFRTLIQDLHVGVLLQGPQTEILLSNSAALDLLGVTEDQLLGRSSFDPLWNVIHEDGSIFPATEHPVPQAIATRQPVRGVVMGVYRPAAHDRVWLWMNAEPQLDGDGNIQHVICSFSDITERKRAEAVLQEAEAKYRNLVERLSQVIYTSELGDSGVWSYVSPQIEKLLGFTPQEWMNNPGLWYQQIHPDDRDIQLELEERAFARNEPFESEYRMLTRAGSWIWVRDSGQIFPPQGYGPPIVQGMLMDISERKRAVEALNIRDAQLLANLNTTPNVAIQWYDKDGRILYWNPASESLYGWRSTEAIGKTLDQLTHTPEEQAEFMRIIAKVQETGKPFGPYEVRIRHKAGAESWVLATTFSLPMNDDQIGFVCMDVDITERKQAEERIQQQLRRLNALHSIDMAINSSVNIQITLEVLLTQLLSQLKMDAADVLLFNQPAQTLELIVGRGFRSNIALQSHQRVSEGFAGQVINERRTIHISNLMEAGKNLRQMLLLANDSFTEYFGLPLIAKGQIKGVLEIYQRTALEPDEDWLNFLEVLAGQAAIAIDNAQLLQGLQRSNMELVLAYDATIEGWSRAMDLRDKETEGHTQRVTTMTLDLARAMGIREADILHIQRGGLLHDIGKLGVPDNILLKPGELTAAEWETMRQHPAYAFNMLANIPYLKQSLDIPYCHHEKWDGTGYPQGLKGEQIPLSARIFAVADVWDALTNDRPYRKAWTKEKTIEFIKEQSGAHFDPKVVKVFLTMISKKLQEAFE